MAQIRKLLFNIFTLYTLNNTYANQYEELPSIEIHLENLSSIIKKTQNPDHNRVIEHVIHKPNPKIHHKANKSVKIVKATPKNLKIDKAVLDQKNESVKPQSKTIDELKILPDFPKKPDDSNERKPEIKKQINISDGVKEDNKAKILPVLPSIPVPNQEEPIKNITPQLPQVPKPASPPLNNILDEKPDDKISKNDLVNSVIFPEKNSDIKNIDKNVLEKLVNSLKDNNRKIKLVAYNSSEDAGDFQITSLQRLISLKKYLSSNNINDNRINTSIDAKGASKTNINQIDIFYTD